MRDILPKALYVVAALCLVMLFVAENSDERSVLIVAAFFSWFVGVLVDIV